jgi:hypothetical protein
MIYCRHCGEPIIQVHCGAWVTSDGIEDCPKRDTGDGYTDHEPQLELIEDID